MHYFLALLIGLGVLTIVAGILCVIGYVGHNPLLDKTFLDMVMLGFMRVGAVFIVVFLIALALKIGDALLKGL